MLNFGENLGNVKSDDRVFVIRPIKDKAPVSVTGLVDPRLFKGGNALHAKLDVHSSMWYLQYECGVLPQALKQKFTNFSTLLKYVENYMKKRNLEIVEVKD